MAVELGVGRPEFATTGNMLKGFVERILHREESPKPSSLFSERARKRKEAYERKDARTYIGKVYLRTEQNTGSGQQEWSFQDAAPILPPNAKPNIDYGDHVLRNGDYLTIFNPRDRSQVVWEGVIDLYTKGIRDPQGKEWGLVDQRGVDSGDFFEWFNGNYPAELRTSVEPGSSPAGETARSGNNVLAHPRIIKSYY